jgi:hypothetical protein
MPLGVTLAQTACIAGFSFFAWKLAMLVHPRATRPRRVQA